MYSKILVPLDGSPTAETILKDIEELARSLNAEVILFQAIQSLTEIMSGSHIAPDVAHQAIEDDRRQVKTYLDRIAGDLTARGVRARHHTAEGHPAATILNYCREEGIDLIAMTTHGRSGLRRTLFGSVADEVMRDSHLPVLVLRPES